MSKKEVVLVTGASKGIGEAIAIKLAKENYDVIIFGRDVQRLIKLKEKLVSLNSNTIYFNGDVSNEEFVNESINKIFEKYNKIDAVINNAGIAHFIPFAESNLEQFKEQIDVNLYGVYNFSRAVINHMIKRKHGTIINISSLSGKVGFQLGTMYSATKHAVMGFSRSLMQEVRKFDVRVVAICPGSVVTDMILNSPIHPKNSEKVLYPEDVAEVVFTTLKLPQRALVSEIEIRPNNP